MKRSKFKPIAISNLDNRKKWLTAGILFGLVMIVAYFGVQYFTGRASTRWLQFSSYHKDPSSLAAVTFHPGDKCGDAPFAFPTTGVIFGLWNQSYRVGHTHAGLDIFPASEEGVMAVYAAYPGYLTRKSDWSSTVIIRIPNDPLDSTRQIWTYYTHMASADGIESFVSAEFPQGTAEVFVEAGTFLGYQGTYSGNPSSPTGLHLHFSVVREENGIFLNELEIKNTYDPSPYFGFDVDHQTNQEDFPYCLQDITNENWILIEETYENK
jgi:peptidoglycan LD-endopeptidase LytH